jgi:hypothetical protein
MHDEAYQEWLEYQALMQRLRPGEDAPHEAPTLDDCIVMYIDDVFDALEDELLHGGRHG